MLNAKNLALAALLVFVIIMKLTQPPVDCKALAQSPGFNKADLEIFVTSGCPADLLNN